MHLWKFNTQYGKGKSIMFFLMHYVAALTAGDSEAE